MADVTPVIYVVALLIVVSSVFIILYDIAYSMYQVTQEYKLLEYSYVIYSDINHMFDYCIVDMAYTDNTCMLVDRVQLPTSVMLSLLSSSIGSVLVISYEDFNYTINISDVLDQAITRNYVTTGAGGLSYVYGLYFARDGELVEEVASSGFSIVAYFKVSMEACDSIDPVGDITSSVLQSIDDDVLVIFYVSTCAG